jgi:adenosylcobyric acid synthase
VLKGYEIHMGRTAGETGLFTLRRFPGSGETVPDGSRKGSVWGTYLHGIFDHDRFRRELINALRRSRGLPEVDSVTDYARERESALDRWASVLKDHLDMKFIEGLVR